MELDWMSMLLLAMSLSSALVYSQGSVEVVRTAPCVVCYLFWWCFTPTQVTQTAENTGDRLTPQHPLAWRAAITWNNLTVTLNRSQIFQVSQMAKWTHFLLISIASSSSSSSSSSYLLCSLLRHNLPCFIIGASISSCLSFYSICWSLTLTHIKTIEGFGGALTESAAHNFFLLQEDLQAQVSDNILVVSLDPLTNSNVFSTLRLLKRKTRWDRGTNYETRQIMTKKRTQ